MFIETFRSSVVGMQIVSNSDPKVKKIGPYSLQKQNWKKNEIVNPFTGIGGLNDRSMNFEITVTRDLYLQPFPLQHH